jgi:predicted nucleotidyltransferase
MDNIDQNRISAYCKENGIKKLSFFGSVLTNKFTDASDVDILVEFFEESIPGLLGFARMEKELSQIIGRKADIKTAEELSEYFRETVVKEAEVKYGSSRLI